MTLPENAMGDCGEEGLPGGRRVSTGAAGRDLLSVIC